MNQPLEALKAKANNEAANIPYCFMDKSEIIESAIRDGATEAELLEVANAEEIERAKQSIARVNASDDGLWPVHSENLMDEPERGEIERRFKGATNEE